MPKTLGGRILAMLGHQIGLHPTGHGEGGGVRRARERLAAKRKRNHEVYGDLPGAPPSRQVLRAAIRRAEKVERGMRKEAAMREGRMGGAAAIR